MNKVVSAVILIIIFGVGQGVLDQYGMSTTYHFMLGGLFGVLLQRFS